VDRFAFRFFPLLSRTRRELMRGRPIIDRRDGTNRSRNFGRRWRSVVDYLDGAEQCLDRNIQCARETREDDAAHRRDVLSALNLAEVRFTDSGRRSEVDDLETASKSLVLQTSEYRWVRHTPSEWSGAGTTEWTRARISQSKREPMEECSQPSAS
jgi:hypothetical protein